MSIFSASTEPFALFRQWLEEAAGRSDIAEPTAMSLATCGADSCPSVRIVLLKAHDARGFVFYTNLESRKSRELKENPNAGLCFYWMPLERQVRITGKVEPVGAEEADAYFASRVREKQLGAWASRQSSELPERKLLQTRIEEVRKEFGDGPIPRPPFWSGWRVVPAEVEFWQQGDYRLHERLVFTRKTDGWEKTFLYP